MTAILTFQIFRKNCKKKKAYILKPLRDRVILTKFFTTGYLCGVAIPISQNILSPKKWRPFLIFHKKCKIQKCLYLENRAR